MSINEIQQEIIDEFAFLEDWAQKYEYIIDLGKKLPPLPDVYKTDDNKIKGCQSNVWLIAELRNGLLHFDADSDALIVKGLVSLLIRVLGDQKPEEVASANLFFIDEIGMTKHLAQTRSNGLLSMVKQMKFYALAYNLKQD